MSKHFQEPDSLRHIAWRNLLLILLGIVIAATVTAIQFRQHLEWNEFRLAQELARHHALLISQQIDLYRRIVHNLANTREVRDLLLVTDRQAAEQWARSHRHLLPDAVGLALVDEDGNILGDPPALRVGPGCLADLKRAVHSDTMRALPAHFEVQGLEHFDLLTEVRDDAGQHIGLLFASFRLARLQQFVQTITGSGEALEIRDARGQVLASTNHLPDDAETLDFTQLITATGWQMHLHIQRDDLAPVMSKVILVTMAIIAFIILMVARLQRRIVRAVQGDYQAIITELERLLGVDATEASKGPPVFHLRETRELANRLYGLIERLRLHQQELAGLGLTDELTGLPNRRHFNQQVGLYADLAREGTPVALVLIDMDGFKLVNDRYGHDQGDALLRLLARVLRNNIREGDFAARLGGDEFVVVLADIERPYLQRWFRHLLDDFLTAQAEAMPELVTHPVTLSAGFAFFEPERDRSPSHVLRRADLALYQAKHAGKGRING